MKLVRYEHHGFALLGVISHDKVQSLPQGLSALDVLNMPLAERNLLEAQAGRHHRAPLGSVRLLPPIEPRAMRDFVAFERHIAGMKKNEPGDGSVPAAWYEAPVHLYMNPWSAVGAHDDVPAPPETQALDFEMEVAAIIGRTARNVPVEEAESYVAGYCIMNDWSARDIQGREMTVGLGPAKGKDFATTLGPWITTADELEPYREGDRLALEMVVSVNGVEVGRDNAREMSWSWGEIVAHAARGATVGAGDVLASGTCSGGSLAEIWARTGSRTPPPLTPGDVVEMTVEGLGTISNRVVASEPLPDPVRPRVRSHA
ncbi:fumarylacetoacetate hydrolase family protein [Demequina pelophila]|uniref:fumarylacetoacetate hydrolase family protein n=1 Tax=Demequina pelophila TaxID=1638984 RepID=UPI000785885E|nr:fumarylacetoacetate hydrolase family protein [Demequina pelophila]